MTTLSAKCIEEQKQKFLEENMSEGKFIELLSSYKPRFNKEMLYNLRRNRRSAGKFFPETVTILGQIWYRSDDVYKFIDLEKSPNRTHPKKSNSPRKSQKVSAMSLEDREKIRRRKKVCVRNGVMK